MVIGRSVKVGLEIRFLTSVDSPMRIIEPTLALNPNADKGSSADCILQFRMNNVLTPELIVRSAFSALYIYVFI